MATLAAAAGGKAFPSLPVTLAYVAACGGDQRVWRARWREVADELAAGDGAGDGAGGGSEDASGAPYRGLESFEPGDAEWFFGRQRLVDELLDRLSKADFVAVFGPSGSGKSSLLRAGVLPALERGAIPGAADWPVSLVTPGEHPVEALAVELARTTGASARSLRDDLMAEPGSIGLAIRQALPTAASTTARVVLVIDQFEEIFTVCRDRTERANFIDCLLAAVNDAGGRAKVVVGARADFYARCAEHPALVAALRDRQLLVGALGDEELREVVAGPAARAGLRVERALVEVIVADARGEPGALPLVSHAMLETWRRRGTGALTLAAYRAAGGIRGGIAQTAERVFAELDPARREIARDVFLRLTALGEGTEDTRRRVRLTELLDGPDRAAVAAVLDRLAAARLVTVDEDTVQVAHEAVIEHWPRLREWLTADRDLLCAHRRLTEAAAEWDQHGKDDELVYRGARLAAWDQHDLARLNDVERAFLSAGRRRQTREHAAGRNRRRWAMTGLVSAITSVTVLAAVALVQASNAGSERDLAAARQLAAAARDQLQIDPAEAVRLARRAYGLKPTVQTEDVLRQATLEAGLNRVVSRSAGPVYGIAFSPNGGRLAVVTDDRRNQRVIRVDRVGGTGGTGRAGGTDAFGASDWWQDDAARSPVFHPDGRHLAAVGQDGVISVWDTSAPRHGDGALVARLGYRGAAASAAFSPDGRRLASADNDGTVRIWDWAARDARPVSLPGHGDKALSVAYSPDGRRIAAGAADGSIRIWTTGRRAEPLVLRGHKGSVTSVAFSPDGRRLASGSADGSIRVWTTGRRAEPLVLLGHTGAVASIGYSPDGRRIASGGEDGTIRMWDTANAVHPQILQGGHGKVWSVAYAPDGRTLASGSDDGTTQLWDATGSGSPVILRGHKGPVWDATVSRDGREVASAGKDGTVMVHNTDGTGIPVVLRGHAGQLLGVAFSPDGARVAAAGADGTIRIWNADGTGDPITLRGLAGPAWDVAFTPDGGRVIATSDQAFYQWNANRSNSDPTVVAETVNHLKDQPQPPDGGWSARAAQGMLRTYQLGRRDPTRSGTSGGLAFHEAISSDGHRMATSGMQKDSVQVWNPNGISYPVTLRGHQGRVRSIAISADGRLAATTGDDDTVRVWKTTGAGQPLVFHAHGISAENVNFAPDGRLVTTYDDGTVKIWRCEVCGPMNEVLALAANRARPMND